MRGAAGTAFAAEGQRHSSRSPNLAYTIPESRHVAHTSLEHPLSFPLSPRMSAGRPTHTSAYLQNLRSWNSHPQHIAYLSSPPAGRPGSKEALRRATKITVRRHPRPPHSLPGPPRRRQRQEGFACGAWTSSRACGASPTSRKTCGKAARHGTEKGKAKKKQPGDMIGG